MLDRLMAARPEDYFKAMVELAQVLHRALCEPNEFDRRRIREEALHRVEQRAGEK